MSIVKTDKTTLMKHLLLVLSIFIAGAAFSQTTEDVVYEYQKGKKYIVHFVQAGNTLWRIQETYGVPAKDIIAANPGIEKGIVEGQKILVPKGVAEVKYPDGTIIKEHVVVKGETLYKLAKNAGVTPEEITKLNPGSETGLKLGQVVKIPMKSVTEQSVKEPVKDPVTVKVPVKQVEDTVIAHTVLDHETLYSISKRFMGPVEDLQKFNNLKNTNIKPGQVLQIPLKKEKIKQVEIRKVGDPIDAKRIDDELLFKKKEEYHIAVMLPFYLDGSGGDPQAQGLKDVATQF
jgi:LysM repeat protein